MTVSVIIQNSESHWRLNDFVCCGPPLPVDCFVMPMKRPSASSSSSSAMKVAKKPSGMNDTVTALKALQDKPENEENDEIETRDKLKAEKFARMKASGSLPDFIVAMYEEESKKQVAPRRFQTELINRLFVKKNGQWQLDLSHSMFTDFKAVYQRNYSKDKQKAIPRSLMCGLYFQGNDNKFEDALRDGEIEMVREEGKVKFFAFKEYTVGKERGTKKQMEMRGDKKATADQHVMMGELFSKLNWSFNTSSGDQKKLDKQTMPANYLELLKKGRDACDRLAKETTKLLEKVPGDKKLALKDGYTVMTKHLTNLDHIKMFVETPDGKALTPSIFEMCMGDVASSVDQFNQKVEEIKGFLKAKKN